MLAEASSSNLQDSIKTWDLYARIKAFVADGAISDKVVELVGDTLLKSGDIKVFAPKRVSRSSIHECGSEVADSSSIERRRH
jgi:hypothetical protein